MHFKNTYRPTTSTINDENGDIPADSHNMLKRWKITCQSLNVRETNDGRQTDVHTAEALVSWPSSFQDEMLIKRLERHKSPSIKCRQNWSNHEVNHYIFWNLQTLILSGITKNCHSSAINTIIIAAIYKRETKWL